MARSLRRNGKWEFSALLLHQRPVSCRIAAGKLTALSGQLNSILVCADSQETGAEQRLYTASTMTGELTVDQLAVFQGNYLDIDMWSSANFVSVV